VRSQRHWTHNIRVGTKRVTDLVNTLVSLARFENGEMALNLETYDFSANIKETLRVHRPRMNKKNIQLRMEIEPKVRVRTDRVLASLLFATLLDNAIKYTNEGGKIKVEVRSLSRTMVIKGRKKNMMKGGFRGRQELLECRLTNTGVGIDPAELELIFESFYRSERYREEDSVEGHGLGLAIARVLLERLDGEIKVQSTPNVTTSFTYQLPLDLGHRKFGRTWFPKR
jgi:signal transduction histidine kinase